MLLLLVGAAVIHFIMGSTREGIIMLVAILLVAAISIVQDTRTRKTLVSLENFTSPAYRVLRGYEWTSLKSEELVVNDIVALEEGTMVPADAALVSTDDFTVNESILTGESVPVTKYPMRFPAKYLQARRSARARQSAVSPPLATLPGLDKSAKVSRR